LYHEIILIYKSTYASIFIKKKSVCVLVRNTHDRSEYWKLILNFDWMSDRRCISIAPVVYKYNPYRHYLYQNKYILIYELHNGKS